MPTPMRRCLEPGCSELSINSRCPTHTRDKEKRHNDERSYYKSGHWQRLRSACLALYGDECAICGSTDLVEVHHVEPRPKNAPNPTTLDVLTNCLPLCGQHHRELEADVRTGRPSVLRKIAEVSVNHE